jgi:hypothetical protein
MAAGLLYRFGVEKLEEEIQEEAQARFLVLAEAAQLPVVFARGWVEEVPSFQKRVA